MDRVFLDANVLFSAAYKPSSRLTLLWKLSDIQLVSSDYAVKEAEINLGRVKFEAIKVLETLLKDIEQLHTDTLKPLPPNVFLVEKDAPILQAAITTKATHLLTGDVKHFRNLYGNTIEGVKILLPVESLKSKAF